MKYTLEANPPTPLSHVAAPLRDSDLGQVEYNYDLMSNEAQQAVLPEVSDDTD